MTDERESELASSDGDSGAGDHAADGETEDADDAVGTDPLASIEGFRDVVERVGRPVVTPRDAARTLGVSQAAAVEALATLADSGDVRELDVAAADAVYFSAAARPGTTRERVVAFPDRREVVVHHPAQLTRAQLSQFARLAVQNGEAGYVYEVHPEDVWAAPYERLEDLLATVRDVLPGRSTALEEYVAEQWERARKFTLRTHEDGYTVLEAANDDLMGNVAREVLEEGQLRALVEDDVAWIAEGATVAVKRALYDAGYPVRDERDLAGGDSLEFSLRLELRDYQRSWVERFEERGAGVLVGPSGSGKTVAAMGIMAAVGGETLVLVPGRELAEQWRETLLANTTLAPDQVGVFHGGEKERRPVTIATYSIAGMDRHRSLFDAREWGLIVYDEAHRMPAPVNRATAELQSRHRLGLTASPVREDDAARDVYALIGPPIGTDWDALFDAGHVAEPSVEIRYVGWDDEDAREAYQGASSHERRQRAATNPAKVDAVADALAERPGAKALVFVDYLDQGDALADALDAPFVSGETPHSRRAALFDAFRRGEERVLVVSRVADEGIDLPDAELAVVASGLGGSARQGTQRAGRTMRPAGDSNVVVLATRGTREAEFARRRLRYLREKGVEVTERDVGD
ncbi:MAG: DEAD/DEAH box helicase [Halobacteriaceae archaeon]